MTGALDHADGRVMWARLVSSLDCRAVCEIGVFKGHLAECVLARNPAMTRYVLVDPWRHLPDWSKPANKSDDEFSGIHAECMARLAGYYDKLVTLRGTTQEVIDTIPDGSLDAVFIDGDHTLKGITIDLGLAYPKLRDGGVIGMDDFTRNIWQHGRRHAPSMVFPYAVYFAELMGIPCYSMPNSQAWLYKDASLGFRFHDRFGYADLTPWDVFGSAS